MSAQAVEVPAMGGFAALRHVGWPHIRAAILLGLAITAWNAIVFLQPLLDIAQTMPLGLLVLELLIADQIRAACLIAAIVIADRTVDEGARRRHAYLLAALFGCITGFVMSEPFDWAWRSYVLPDHWPADWSWLHGTPSHFYWPLFRITLWLPTGGAVVFLYADRRAALRTAQLLHAAELDRLRRSRIALESRLQAMQARVEPQFLFNTLAQLESLYKLDRPLAARMMDDLIAYLRAAMPMMRDTSSTVAQEIELARAYLDIVRLRLGDRLVVRIEAPPKAAQMRMPPMMLLPLIDHAVLRGFDASTATSTLSVRAAVDAGRLRLTIADSGAGFIPETGGADVIAIRERLTALYGDQGALRFRRSDAASTEAVLDIPLEYRAVPSE